jgi:transposase
MKTSKSALRVAYEALELARRCYAPYSSPKSPRKFTQPQLVACLVLKEFLRQDYRGVQRLLSEWSDLRDVLKLSDVPHFTTLCAAHRRLLSKPQTHRLFDEFVVCCRRRGLLGRTSRLAAMDSTGLESRYVSHYFTRRCDRQSAHYQARFPKLSAVCDIACHVVLGLTVDRGPQVDHVEFRSTLRDALARQRIEILVADAGYDSEKAHRFCREQLGITSIVPPHINGRLRQDGAPRRMTGRYRLRLRRWFPRKTYGQRWQIETVFSMIKRRLGPALRSRSYYAQCREVTLKVLTHNLMILLRRNGMFYTEHTAYRFL